MTTNSHHAANVRDYGKERDMKGKKITILYERLSRDDGEDSVSDSIVNQRKSRTPGGAGGLIL